ncbi:MAG: hypothetical protein ACRC0V_06455 [Fusobacteriaceae bacterium]
MENIENIFNGNIESRINAYVYFKELNSQNNFKSATRFVIKSYDMLKVA